MVSTGSSNVGHEGDHDKKNLISLPSVVVVSNKMLLRCPEEQPKHVVQKSKRRRRVADSNNGCDVQEQCEESEFRVFDKVNRSLEKVHETQEQLFVGTAVSLIYSCRRMQGDVIVVDDTHTCDKHCNMTPYNFVVYRVGQTDLCHICVSGVCPHLHQPTCHISKSLHSGLILYRSDSALFICKTTNSAHICSPHLCNTELLRTLDGMVCSISGKIVKDTHRLSSGWTEDNWRCPVQLRGKRKIPCNKKRTLTLTQSGMLHADLVSCKTLQSELLDVTVNIVRQLLPLSDNYNRMQIVQHNRFYLKFKRNLVRYLNQCKDKCVQMNIVYMQQIASCIESQMSKPSDKLVIEPEKMESIAHAYGSVILQHYIRLLNKCDLGDMQFDEFVVANLYLQKTSFIVKGIHVFDNDLLLKSLLPPAHSFEFFDFVDKSTFTTSKKLIQEQILVAIENGLNPTNLSVPMVSMIKLCK